MTSGMSRRGCIAYKWCKVAFGKLTRYDVLFYNRCYCRPTIWGPRRYGAVVITYTSSCIILEKTPLFIKLVDCSIMIATRTVLPFIALLTCYMIVVYLYINLHTHHYSNFDRFGTYTIRIYLSCSDIRPSAREVKHPY